MLRIAVLVLLLECSYGQSVNRTCLSSDGIQDMRLVDGTYGDFMGRVEIRNKGVWGTVCDDSWSISDANVVCRMMGFSGAVCSVSRARFGQGPSGSPIWLTNVRCNSNDDCLGDCSFYGLNKPITSCSHREDAGVVCQTGTPVSPPNDLVLLNSTTTTLSFQFSALTTSQLPLGSSSFRYRLSYTDEDGLRRNSYHYFTRSNRDQQITKVLTNLRRDRQYSVQLSVDYRYSSSICSTYINGPPSNALVVRTNATSRPSNIQVRLVSASGTKSFMGRLEVLYNGTWGTVCDDGFGTTDANVFCRALGFERAICVPFFRTSAGSGPIWLDNVACPSSGEIIEDCSHPGWGVHNCGHSENVKVVCEPGKAFIGKVKQANVTDVKTSSATIRWDHEGLGPQTGDLLSYYQILYRPVGRSYWFTRTTSRQIHEYTLSGLAVDVTYEVAVRIKLTVYSCYDHYFPDDPFFDPFPPFPPFPPFFFGRDFYGEESDTMNFTTYITAPDGPPTNFHVSVINSTAVEVQWDAPLYTLRNGDILGYIVSVIPEGGTEQQTDYFTNGTGFDFAKIVGGLVPSSFYLFSVLAYNGGGWGPRTVYLRAQTYANGTDPVISRFGIYGNGLDRANPPTSRRNIQIHCGTTQSNVLIDWFTSSGEKVGTTNRNLREAHYNNGTTVLQIAAFRRLNTCDGGVYTCVANDTNSRKVHRKNFTLIIGYVPEKPIRPVSGLVTSNSIQIVWEASFCSGGHKVVAYNIRYYDESAPTRIYQSIRHIAAPKTNYTLKYLSSSTSYVFQVQAVTSDYRTSSWSSTRTITTLPPAPSPPRHVSVRIVSIFVVEVSWRPPAVLNGNITRYTVYLIPLIPTGGDQTTRLKRQAVQTSKTITMTFSGTETSGNITVPSTDVSYRVQVTASINTGDEFNEGGLSLPLNISFPVLELPVPQNVQQVDSTNSSITVEWDLPPPPFLPIEEFHVKYSSKVKWTTPKGHIIDFLETGSVSVTPPQMRVVIEPLTPGTEYMFIVEARFQQISHLSASAKGKTHGKATNEGRVAFLQLKLGPVDKCSSFQTGSFNERIALIGDSLIKELNKLCSCGLTVNNLQNGTFSCDGLVEQVVYRSRILGNDRYSAGDLVSLLQTWVAEGTAALHVGLFRFNVDPTCFSFLDSLDSPDCPIIQPPTSAVTTIPSLSTNIVLAITGAPGITTGEAITIMVWFFVILVLVGVVILLSIILFRRKWPKKPRIESAVRFRNEHEEDREPFANIGPVDQNNAVLEHD